MFAERRAVAAALLPDDEQQADAPLAAPPQTLGRRQLRGEDALRIARAPAVEPAAFDPRSGRTAARSRVRRQDDVGRIESAKTFERPRATGCSVTV